MGEAFLESCFEGNKGYSAVDQTPLEICLADDELRKDIFQDYILLKFLGDQGSTIFNRICICPTEESWQPS